MGKKRRKGNQGVGMRDAPHRDDPITKIQNRIAPPNQKADKTPISEAPTNKRLKQYAAAMKEDGYATKEEISTALPRERAIANEAKIDNRTWWGRVAELAGSAKPKEATAPDESKGIKNGKNRRTKH